MYGRDKDVDDMVVSYFKMLFQYLPKGLLLVVLGSSPDHICSLGR